MMGWGMMRMEFDESVFKLTPEDVEQAEKEEEKCNCTKNGELSENLKVEGN